MTPSQHELFSSNQVVNFNRFTLVNLSRSTVVSLNRSRVVNFTGFCNEDLKESKLDIINSLGQIVYTLNNPDQKQEIDLSFLASGVYYLVVQNRTEQKAVKLIKE